MAIYPLTESEPIVYTSMPNISLIGIYSHSHGAKTAKKTAKNRIFQKVKQRLK